MKRVIKAAEGLNSKQRQKIAKNSTDPKELSRLAYDNSDLVRLAVLKNYNTPEKVKQALCEELVDSRSKDIRLSVALRTSDEKLLAKLAEDESVPIRKEVAESTDDEELLWKLADDESADVRYAVAERTNDPEILAKLADDENWSVREEVAKRTDDPELLTKLADDEDYSVREAVFERHPEFASKPRTKKPTQTDWSIPLYSIQNYSEIEDEIDAVITEAANLYAQKYLGEKADVTIPQGVFDNGGQITIEIGDNSFEIDAEDILPPATSKNKKKDCVKTLITWMGRNLV